MAASNPPHPLQVLDQMFNEVLVQTGKHLRANMKDGPKNANANTTRTSTVDSLTTYHYALDDLESEITRAKAVVLRDLEKLRAARAPPPAPAPAPTPTPVPAPQPVAPPAPMMELPSSAAHTMSAPAFAPKKETKGAAPFPDMGMGMSSDNMIDLTSSEKKPSPRVAPGAIRPPGRPSPVVKHDVRPSPKQAHKPSPKLAQPAKVTPVPPPQIPRLQNLQPPQPPSIGPAATTQSQSTAPNAQPARTVQATPAAQAAQDATINATLVPNNAVGADTNATGGNTLNFTDMQFSLAPPSNDAPGAPPAPMPEFDLTTFAPQGSNDILSLDNSKPSNTTAAPQQPKEQDKTDSSNLDDLFNLDSNNGGDNMFDLGGGGANDSTFDDMMYFDNNDADMSFDEAYFFSK
ncbi:uncharacterized protein F4822DRAFT_423862 [Hypoxylon trugodes]|uniref:uncharacterized protein n=1 Tax=Hypoxylon trugodes TaxID=326681 RepID=UPI0021961E74|nr:uncharacterized protein F4822DRAFT_423862 [Hypoxylon trugodes]KAI1393394.1 hypothetical protein F4822DRAFT_423862 [Hypoxylon trugodes]